MLNSKLVKEAHSMAKEIKAEYPEVNYKFQFGLCLSYLLNKGEVKMVELKGTEKQIAWAEDIRKKVIDVLDVAIEKSNKHKEEFTTIKNKLIVEDDVSFWIYCGRNLIIQKFATTEEDTIYYVIDIHSCRYKNWIVDEIPDNLNNILRKASKFVTYNTKTEKYKY